MNIFYDNKIFRFINKNILKIILVVIMIIFGILIIKILNFQAGAKYNQASSHKEDKSLSNEVKKSQQDIMTKTTIDKEEASEKYDLISNFIEYCNNNEIDKAYNLLTDECKENVYSSVENFNKNYVNVIFKEKRFAEIQSWIKNEKKHTYLVKFTGDIISSGNSDYKDYQDYITIDESEKKLNINRYIGRKKITKKQESNNIIFEINYIDLYYDYEIYNLKVSNKNDGQIILDNLENTTNTYIETDKKNKIKCLNYEFGVNNFKFNTGVSKELNMKFIKQYNPNIVDKKINFSNAILKKDNGQDIKKLKIELEL